MIAIFLQINIKGFIEALIEVGIEIILIVVFVAILVRFAKEKEQFWRTLTAYFVCQDFIFIFGVPILMWVTITDSAWAYYILAAVVLWMVAVFAHINNQLTDSGLFVSTLLSLAFFVSVYGVGFLILLVLL